MHTAGTVPCCSRVHCVVIPAQCCQRSCMLALPALRCTVRVYVLIHWPLRTMLLMLLMLLLMLVPAGQATTKLGLDRVLCCAATVFDWS